MFATGMYPTGDAKLDEYIQDCFIGMIEMEVLDHLNSCWDKKESPEEYLDGIFPRAFIHRNPQKAVEIIYDLDDIARSPVVRESLPPLHLYAMYRIIRDYEAFKNDMGATEYDQQVESYIRGHYTKEDADWYCFFFAEPSEIFVEQYDDEYIWLDLWEHRFVWYLNHPEEFPVLTPQAEEMLQLMPNDILEMWRLCEKMHKDKPSGVYNEYDFFVSHATEDKKAVAEPLALELRAMGAKVWLDKFEMTVGSSLRTSIDYGIAHSKHGIIILSKNYMRKFWTEKEMNALFAKLSLDDKNSKILLPLWHGVTREEVAQYSPMMADLLALDTGCFTIHELAEELFRVL